MVAAGRALLLVADVAGETHAERSIAAKPDRRLRPAIRRGGSDAEWSDRVPESSSYAAAWLSPARNSGTGSIIANRRAASCRR